MLIKSAILLLFTLIIAALGSALFTLTRTKERSPKTARALMMRIVLSIVLFLFLMAAYLAGLIQPHGIHPGYRKEAPPIP